MAIRKLRALSKIPVMVVLIAIIVVVGFLVTQPEQRNAKFWISMGALILSVLGMFFAFRVDDARPVPAPGRMSFWVVGLLYFVVMLCAVILFGAVVSVSTGTHALVLVLVSLVFVGLMPILAWFGSRAGGLETEARQHRAENTALLLLVQEGRQSLEAGGLAETAALKAKIRLLEEKVRYSDPVATEETAAMDAEIATRAAELTRQIKELEAGNDLPDRAGALEAEAQDLVNTIERRNKLRATLKQSEPSAGG